MSHYDFDSGYYEDGIEQALDRDHEAGVRANAARTSTATADTVCACSTPGFTHSPTLHAADTGLRERVEALLVPTYPTAADETWGTNGHIEPIDPADLRAALDATPASTEDRADNEGTP